MKKHLTTISLILAIGALLLGLYSLSNNQKDRGIEIKNDLSGAQSLSTAYGLYNGIPMTATSTPRVTSDGTTHWYVEENNGFNLGKTDETLTGTTSIIVSTGGADMLDFNLFQVGTNTNYYLTWDVEYSNDRIGFFSGTLYSDQADFQTRVGTSSYSNEGFTLEGTTTTNIQVNPMGSRFVKLNLGAVGSIGVATGTVHVEVVKRNKN